MWVAQSIKHLPSAQVRVPRLAGVRKNMYCLSHWCNNKTVVEVCSQLGVIRKWGQFCDWEVHKSYLSSTPTRVRMKTE